MGSKDTIRLKKKLERKLAKEGVKCMNSFYHFFITFWPEMSGEEYQDAPHIKYICDTLQYWGMKVIDRERIMKTIVINVPPGSSKSTIATICFPLWCWLHSPNLSTANISYSATLSAGHAFKSRGIIDSEKWHLLFDNIFALKYGKPLGIIQQNQTKIVNNFKGDRFNTSVGGTILGMHADIFIKDDLVSAEQANSDVEREKANRWNDETTSSRRKVPYCYLDVYISQRLHENDVCGHVLKKNLDITWICLPSEITNTNRNSVRPEEAIELYTDGILDINRRPRDVLAVLKEEMGSNGYNGQYLQVPFNVEEQDITPSMFNKVHLKEVPENAIWDLWIDAAYTEKNENDPTGIDIISKINGNLVIKESYDLWKKLPDLLRFIVELEKNGSFDKNKSRIFIEPKASGYSLAQYIENDTSYNYVLIGEHNKYEKKLIAEGKKARHEMIKPKAESGRLTLVEGKWNEKYTHQICGFPRAAHDEHVDNLGYAINHYYMNENTFIDQWALNKLEKNVTGEININITSQIDRYNVSVGYKEENNGDTQLFDYPYKLHNHRYICIASLRNEGDRGGSTYIMIFDRLNLLVSCMFVSDKITPKKAGIKAIEMATMYDHAKIVFIVQNEFGQTASEDQDFSHIALAEVKKVRYDNIYSRLTINNIKQTREREYGYEFNQSTGREAYYHLKDQIETNLIKELPLEVFQEISSLERKKETGEVDGKEGYKVNGAMAYAVALKVNEEIYDKVKVKRR